MASSEKQCNASLYSSLSSVQYNAGYSFIQTLNVKLGHKVLDMGCGTGELSNFIAKLVGDQGEIVGVDPDQARIKLAQENAATNASFHVGNSQTGFPNDDQAYYDLHFSNHVYHWMSNDKKAVYVKAALRCLKPGGLMAIQCLAKPDDDIDSRLIVCALGMCPAANINFADERSVTELLQACGFTDIEVKLVPSVTYYPSFKVYATSFLAAGYTDINDLPDKALLEEFKLKSLEEDGRVKSRYNLIQIRGRKS